MTALNSQFSQQAPPLTACDRSGGFRACARAVCCPPRQHGAYPARCGAQAYKLVAALVEKAVGRAAPEQRLNVLYSLSAICRRSKALRGAKDKYGAFSAGYGELAVGCPGCHALLAVRFGTPSRGTAAAFSCAQAPGYLVFSAPLYRSGAHSARARSVTQLGSGCRGREGHSLHVWPVRWLPLTPRDRWELSLTCLAG